MHRLPCTKDKVKPTWTWGSGIESRPDFQSGDATTAPPMEVERGHDTLRCTQFEGFLYFLSLMTYRKQVISLENVVVLKPWLFETSVLLQTGLEPMATPFAGIRYATNTNLEHNSPSSLPTIHHPHPRGNGFSQSGNHNVVSIEMAGFSRHAVTSWAILGLPGTGGRNIPIPLDLRWTPPQVSQQLNVSLFM